MNQNYYHIPLSTCLIKNFLSRASSYGNSTQVLLLYPNIHSQNRLYNTGEVITFAHTLATIRFTAHTHTQKNSHFGIEAIFYKSCPPSLRVRFASQTNRTPTQNELNRRRLKQDAHTDTPSHNTYLHLIRVGFSAFLFSMLYIRIWKLFAIVVVMV